jgi:hypothetical protein
MAHSRDTSAREQTEKKKWAAHYSSPDAERIARARKHYGRGPNDAVSSKQTTSEGSLMDQR